MSQRRGFLKALVGTGAVAAVTLVADKAPTTPQVVEVVRERLVWPDFLPPLVGRPETESDETRRLLQTLLDAEREMLTMPSAQDVTWNGMQFRLRQGPNVVPGPIAYVWRLSEADQAAGTAELFGRVKSKYRNAFAGGV